MVVFSVSLHHRMTYCMSPTWTTQPNCHILGWPDTFPPLGRNPHTDSHMWSLLCHTPDPSRYLQTGRNCKLKSSQNIPEAEEYHQRLHPQYSTHRKTSVLKLTPSTANMSCVLPDQLCIVAYTKTALIARTKTKIYDHHLVNKTHKTNPNSSTPLGSKNLICLNQ